MELNLVTDRLIKGQMYPALATHEARPYTPGWRQFGQHWPFTTPVRMQEYCAQHQVSVNINTIDHYALPAYYPICLGFFDFTIDYFALLPSTVLAKVANRDLKVLFLYHEGDNPRQIKNRLDALCRNHQLPDTSYVFVSANSAADSLPGFVCFHDFELWYYQRNLHTPATEIHTHTRSKDFTVLCRLHKWWRAVAMADLWRQNLLENSYWSYCEAPTDDNINDCPIELDMIPQLRWAVSKFCQQLPHYSDSSPQEQRNDHSITDQRYHSDAYCNIVMESQFDVDGSNGVFLTEKTFKPIKHGQMFFIAGAAGSLQTLRNLGYEVFDDILDNSYDLETNATRRWQSLTESIAKARPKLAQLHQQAVPMLIHNQQLFLTNKQQRLNTLIKKIHEQHC